MVRIQKPQVSTNLQPRCVVPYRAQEVQAASKLKPSARIRALRVAQLGFGFIPMATVLGHSGGRQLSVIRPQRRPARQACRCAEGSCPDSRVACGAQSVDPQLAHVTTASLDRSRGSTMLPNVKRELHVTGYLGKPLVRCLNTLSGVAAARGPVVPCTLFVFSCSLCCCGCPCSCDLCFAPLSIVTAFSPHRCNAHPWHTLLHSFVPCMTQVTGHKPHIMELAL